MPSTAHVVMCENSWRIQVLLLILAEINKSGISVSIGRQSTLDWNPGSLQLAATCDEKVGIDSELTAISIHPNVIFPGWGAYAVREYNAIAI